MCVHTSEIFKVTNPLPMILKQNQQAHNVVITLFQHCNPADTEH